MPAFWLTESFSERTGVRIIYESAFSERLDGETETHLFRIAQKPDERGASLGRDRSSGRACVRRRYPSPDVSDNGKGLTLPSRSCGLGLVGMRARARAARGQLRGRVAARAGVNVAVEIPVPETHMPTKFGILLADDRAVRRGFKLILNQQPDLA